MFAFGLSDMLLDKLPKLFSAVLVAALFQSPALARNQMELYRDREVVANEVLVKFITPRADVAADIRQRDDINMSKRIGNGNVHHLRSRSKNVAALVASLKSRPDVVFAEPNYMVSISDIPNDPNFSSLWGLRNTTTPGADISAVPAWDVSVGSAANVVGVIDTGIDYNHPDLAANMWSAPTSFSVNIGGVTITCAAGTHGFNAISRTCDPNDDNSHGTHVAGTIGAIGNNSTGVVGVSRVARIMALKFLDSTGNGSISDAIDAIEFAIQAKSAFAPSGANVRVLSNSWGGADFSEALLDQINRADAANMLFVVAAGNAGANNDTTPDYPGNYQTNNIVSVAATDINDNRTWFSNYGPLMVDLGAPGENILSTILGNGYGYKSGTSMAAPHVSGAAALILAQCPLSTAQLVSNILSNVDVVSSLSGITLSNGRLNVNRAIRACAPLTPPLAPSTLTATASTNAAINLSWTDNISNETGFKIERKTGAGGTYAPIATTAANVLSFTDSGLAAATTYYYRILATNAAGDSAYSNEASATTAATAAINFALPANGGVASASSVYASGYPIQALNNADRKGLGLNAGGVWADATYGVYPDWVQIDFNGVKSISEIDVITIQDNYQSPVEPTQAMGFSLYGITAFEVQYWNGSAWLTVPGGAVTGNNKVWRQFNFASISTDKIRVLVNNAATSYSHIVEVEAYGTSTPLTPPLAPSTLTATAAARPPIGARSITVVDSLYGIVV